MTATSTPQRRVPQWLVFVLRGTAAILFGAYLILAPVSALITLVRIASLYFLVDGAIRVFDALPDRDDPRRLLRLILGGVEVVTGLIVLGSLILQITLGAAIITLMGLLIGLQAIAGGVLTVIAALREQHHRQMKLGAGISGIVFGAVLILVTAMDDLAIVPFVGLLAVLLGGIQVFIGWRQRSAIQTTA